MSVSPVFPTKEDPKQESSNTMASVLLRWAILLGDTFSVFRSIPLAIVLLSLLALGVLIGVWMPQEGLVELPKIKAQFGENYRWMKALGLFTVYSSYWFICLEVLFFFNLLFGSFQWLRPAYLSATQVTFCSPEHILSSSQQFFVAFPLDQSKPVETSVKTVKNLLNKNFHYRVYQQENKLYASKGNFSRFGPVVAHLGILLLLVSSVYGAFTGFKAQKLVTPGTQFSLNQVDKMMPNMPAPWWHGSIADWRFHIRDFKIQYYPEHPETPQQYYTTIDVRDGSGKFVKTETISVNHPLNLGNLTIYQASFTPTGRLFLKLNDRSETVKINTQVGSRPASFSTLPSMFQTAGSLRSLIVFPFFVQQDPNVKANYIRVFLHDKGRFLGQAPGKMPENLKLAAGESGEFPSMPGLRVTYDKPEMATGLQIKEAPEVFWVYLAFFIIGTGAVMCIFSQRQLWVAFVDKPDDGTIQCLVSYRTNKAKLSFLKELQALYPAMTSCLNPSTPKDNRRADTV
ncbi:MAG: cytochrome c biogenesis protein ResB [Cyanobacteria bacterium]|nr:cytochrome c biogenesis protein ResB [Cyanobacteriota bacterium]